MKASTILDLQIILLLLLLVIGLWLVGLIIGFAIKALEALS